MDNRPCDDNHDIFYAFYDSLRRPNQVVANKIINAKRTNNPELLRRISNYLDKMDSSYPRELLDRLYDNSDCLSLVNRFYLLNHFDFKGFKIANENDGLYHSSKNLIVLKNKDSLEHELSHMASAIVVPSGTREFLGFKDGRFGLGANEAYTQYFAKKHFPNITDTYRRLVKPMSHITYIVGEDKMDKIYLSGGLKDLIDELIKYTSPHELMIIKDLISNMDNLCEYYDDLGPDKEKDDYIIRIYETIIKIYGEKLSSLIEHGDISPEEAMIDYNAFMNNVICDFTGQSLSDNRLYDEYMVRSEIKMRLGFVKYRIQSYIDNEKNKSRLY